jgi:hypothetical protein
MPRQAHTKYTQREGEKIDGGKVGSWEGGYMRGERIKVKGERIKAPVFARRAAPRQERSKVKGYRVEGKPEFPTSISCGISCYHEK